MDDTDDLVVSYQRVFEMDAAPIECGYAGVDGYRIAKPQLVQVADVTLDEDQRLCRISGQREIAANGNPECVRGLVADALVLEKIDVIERVYPARFDRCRIESLYRHVSNPVRIGLALPE